ncbi:hypothetical protein Y032_0014g2263 [Ancylostoma ceylanicum]|uniref:Uncharacterized protein n=1 Tax=Ancylostoma ceylanicum TaxID=53326 RepID=A0A016V9R2_9BILA|nr:hypothetical protein Y032_0014g2263 [Ancylostoma ceylanicum]
MILLLCLFTGIAVEALPYYPVYPHFAHYQMDSTSDVATMVTAPKTSATQVPAPPVSTPTVANQIVDNDTDPRLLRSFHPFVLQQPYPVQYFTYDPSLPFYGTNVIYRQPYQFNYGYPVAVGAVPQYGQVSNAALGRGVNKH